MFAVACSLEFAVKKDKWQGAGTRSVKFTVGGGDKALIKPSGKVLNVTIATGLAKNTSKSYGVSGFVNWISYY